MDNRLESQSCLASLSRIKQMRQKHRCRIVGLEQNKHGQNILLVTILGIKTCLPISYLPEELVSMDNMLREFSQEDVRAITYYAIKNSEQSLDKKINLALESKRYSIIKPYM